VTTIRDDRGVIRNVGHMAVIESRAGSVRSNHKHKTGWHYLFVISGRMTYKTRSTARDVNPGEMVYTGPEIEHRTEFPEDTVMISFASENQGPEHHDEDLVRVEW
jgi:quercetin dioxygenase-like cupin family protein